MTQHSNAQLVQTAPKDLVRLDAGGEEPGGFYAAQDIASRALYARLRQTRWPGLEASQPLEACLCTTILATEPNIEVFKIVEAMPASAVELTMPEFLNTMMNIGYKASQSTVAACEIDRRLFPCLFLPGKRRTEDLETAFVILSVSDSDDRPVLNVFDGRDGRTVEWPVNHPAARSPGQAIFFQSVKRDEEVTSPAMRKQTGQSWFTAVLSRFRGSFWQLVAVGLTLSLVGLGTPLFIMLVYDRVIAPRTSEPLVYLVVGVALSIGMEWLLRSLRSYSLSWLAARLDYVVGTSIFERLIQLPPAFIERASVSAQIARIKTFESVRDFFNGPVFMSVIEMPSILVSIAVIAWFGGPLALVPLTVSFAYIILFYLVRRHVMVAIKQAAKATSSTQQFSIETFEKLEAIRGNGLSNAWLAKFRDLSGRENLAQFRLFFLGSLGETFAHALTMVAAVATLAFGVGLIWDGQISTGVLVASMILTWRVLMPFHSLCTMIPRFEQMRNAVLQINDLMDIATEAETGEVSARLPDIKGRVTFTNAGLRYNRDAGPVFLSLNADIKPGEIVVVSGSNGAGKSSILKLLQGLYLPVTGSVRVDGFDIRQLVQRDLRQLIGYVPQSPSLLAGTLADNLRFGKPLASEEDLWTVLDQVRISDEIKVLPDQLETRAGSAEADNLSSNVLFRLAFARALLLNSSLLLIDEQPNAVMNAGTADIMKSIIQSSRGRRTVIFVSHRGDMMRLADRVIRLKRGQAPVFAPLDQVLEMVA